MLVMKKNKPSIMGNSTSIQARLTKELHSRIELLGTLKNICDSKDDAECVKRAIGSVHQTIEAQRDFLESVETLRQRVKDLCGKDNAFDRIDEKWVSIFNLSPQPKSPGEEVVRLKVTRAAQPKLSEEIETKIRYAHASDCIERVNAHNLVLAAACNAFIAAAKKELDAAQPLIIKCKHDMTDHYIETLDALRKVAYGCNTVQSKSVMCVIRVARGCAPYRLESKKVVGRFEVETHVQEKPYQQV
jgi:hypothetical protein